jgi:protein involved in polysaccharide export with SLBB domain
LVSQVTLLKVVRLLAGTTPDLAVFGTGCETSGRFAWARSPVTFLGRLMKAHVLRLLALTQLLMPGLATAQSPAPATSEEAVLSPGDSVRIAVWRKPEFSGDFVVAPDGSVTHPLFRGVRVGGIPLRTAEANIRAFLARFEQDPQFVMEPLLRVSVSGEVARPQVMAIPPGTTLSEAVARAGGTTQNGKRNGVLVFRNSAGRSEPLVLDLNQPERGVAASPVRSGDQILVERKKSFFRDLLIPTLGVMGSVASIGILIDRYSRGR